MALIDINKNSLPEQVQENKEKIAALESTTATKEYVDDQDAATLGLAKSYADGKDATTLQSAKDYADGKDATTLQSAKDYADLAAAGALGDAKTYTDSGLALKQNALTDSSVPDGTLANAIGFDSNGDLVKAAAAGGGGGLELLWSGSLTLSGTLQSIGTITLENGKIYKLCFGNASVDIKFDTSITYNTVAWCEYLSGGNIYIKTIQIHNTDSKINQTLRIQIDANTFAISLYSLYSKLTAVYKYNEV